MKVYRIKFVENEEIDCGLMGPSWDTTEGILNDVYESEEVALKHIPEDIDTCYRKVKYSVIEQEVINK